MKAAANGHWDVCEFLITEGAKAGSELGAELHVDYGHSEIYAAGFL